MAWFLLARKKDLTHPPVLLEKEESCFKECLSCNCLKQDSDRPEVPYLLVGFVASCGLIYAVILILTNVIGIIPVGVVTIAVGVVLLLGVFVKYRQIMKKIRIDAERGENGSKNDKKSSNQPMQVKRKKVMNSYLMQPKILQEAKQLKEEKEAKRKKREERRRLRMEMAQMHGYLVQNGGAGGGKVNDAFIASPLQELEMAGVSSVLPPEGYELERPRSSSMPSSNPLQNVPYPATLQVPTVRISNGGRETLRPNEIVTNKHKTKSSLPQT